MFLVIIARRRSIALIPLSPLISSMDCCGWWSTFLPLWPHSAALLLLLSSLLLIHNSLCWISQSTHPDQKLHIKTIESPNTFSSCNHQYVRRKAAHLERNIVIITYKWCHLVRTVNSSISKCFPLMSFFSKHTKLEHYCHICTVILNTVIVLSSQNSLTNYICVLKLCTNVANM